MIAQIALAVILSMLILIVEHYWPWPEMLKRHLRLPEKYIMGVLAMVLPLTGLFCLWKSWIELIALWVVVILSGATVLSVYSLDNYLDILNRVTAAEEIEKVLRDGSIED